MDYQRTQTDVVFKPLKRVEELVGKDKNIKWILLLHEKWQKRVIALTFWKR